MITATIGAYIITNTILSVRAWRDDHLFRRALKIEQPAWHVVVAALLLCSFTFLPLQWLAHRRRRRARN